MADAALTREPAPPPAAGAGSVLRDIGTYTVATLLPALLNFAGVILLVRLLGEALWGRVSIVMGAALMIAAYAGGWAAQAVLRFHASSHERGEAPALASTAAALVLRACLLVAIPLAAWLGYGARLGLAAGVAGAGLCTAAALYQLRVAAAQAGFRPGRVMRGEIVRGAALPLAAILTALAARASATLTVALILAGYALGWKLLGGALPALRFERRLAAMLWSYGWPLGLWLGFSQLLAYLDRYIVALHFGYADAGRYAAGFELVRRGLVLALAPVTLAVHPALVARWSAGDRSGARSLWRRALLIQSAAGLLLVALYVPLAGPIQQLAFGFALAWPVNLAMALSGAAWAAALIAHKPLELALRTRTMLAALLGAALLNIIGNIVLVPRSGYAAAAYVSAASACVYLLSVLLLAGRGPVLHGGGARA